MEIGTQLNSLNNAIAFVNDPSARSLEAVGMGVLDICPEKYIINGTKEANLMSNGYSRRIKERIKGFPEGSVFVCSDFSDIADGETIRRNLNRLVETASIRRVINGVFEKPEYSELMGEYVATDPDKVANALARNYHWSIAPSGNAALNLLGLSTQVSAAWSYISDGPYRTYQLNSFKLEFKHRANKEISGLSYLSALVVQALKALGREKVTPEIISRLKTRLSKEDKAALLEETGEATNWIYEVIKVIASEKTGN